jgi:hypothetical protein
VKRLLVCICFGLLAAPAYAHHSAAMFDNSKAVTFPGTVATFEWTNPHAWIDVDIPDASGSPGRWNIELSAVNIIARKGWKKDSFRPGDKVTVTFHPMRDGTKGGQLMQIVAADGSMLTDHDY